MYFSDFGMMGSGFGAFAPWMLLLVVWSLFWKAHALWHAAQRRDRVWFIVLLVLNLVGIPEIIYIFGVAKPKHWTIW